MTPSSGKRVIVTGGAGFIGSALIWALNERGIDDILIVDRLRTDERWKNLVPLRFADYLDADDFEFRVLHSPQDFGDVRTCFHLGACSSTTETDAGYLMRNNFQYSKHVAQWAISAGVRFVYASSAATYGALETDLAETQPLESLRPLNMYAYSKHLFDLYAQRQGWFDKIAGIKYFNVFGPNEEHKGDMRSVVSKAFLQIRESGQVKLFRSYRPAFADGKQERDFIYVKDAVEMTLFLAEKGATGLYNVGSGEARTWIDLVTPIFGAMNVRERIEFIEMPPGLREKYQYSTRASIARLRQAGYGRSVTPLSEAVVDYVTHYLLAERRLEPATQAPPAAAANESSR
ncbi:MAG: ADP-glyceromanno-heptose 6-epimerase [Vulcanimicrobiaceae bacterium]